MENSHNAEKVSERAEKLSDVCLTALRAHFEIPGYEFKVKTTSNVSFSLGTISLMGADLE